MNLNTQSGHVLFLELSSQMAFDEGGLPGLAADANIISDISNCSTREEGQIAGGALFVNREHIASSNARENVPEATR